MFLSIGSPNYIFKFLSYAVMIFTNFFEFFFVDRCGSMGSTLTFFFLVCMCLLVRTICLLKLPVTSVLNNSLVVLCRVCIVYAGVNAHKLPHVAQITRLNLLYHFMIL